MVLVLALCLRCQIATLELEIYYAVWVLGINDLKLLLTLGTFTPVWSPIFEKKIY